MTYQCPVCGFDQMPFPAGDHNICSCCGTEFGYHDRVKSHSDLRQVWITRGAPWFSSALPAPGNWNPYVQMSNAGFTDVVAGSHKR